MELVDLGVTPIGFFETNVIFGLVVFAVALLIKPGEFHNLLTIRQKLGWGLVCQHVILPLSITLTTLVFYMPLGNSTGLIIVAAMPALSLGALLTWVAGGNIALSLLIIGSSSFISAAFAPSLFGLWAHWHPYAVHETSLLNHTPFHSLLVFVTVVFIPALLAHITRRIFPSSVNIAPKLAWVMAVPVFIVPLGLIRSNGEALLGSLLTTGLTVGLIYLGTFFFIFRFMKAIGLGLSATSSITFTAASQNAAIGGLYLLSGLGKESEQVIAGMWWVLFQYYGGMLIALYLHRQVRLTESLSGEDYA